ncbi:hypothetical protein AVEN_121721-1 [Araneus ventricosus]|uniref:Uncharacterized protein n=1 Tax=Araneus ventricosus TaxID=182803 RepID=A0A4Y2QV82_ARAVE|nr:hypothetical protein AVEN_121721-1 [Araneus ventricosus]
MSGEGRSGCSTPSSWDGSQISIDSQRSLSSNYRGYGTNFTPEQKTCLLLLDKHSEWEKLDNCHKSFISKIDTLHQAGQGNSAECIRLTLTRSDYQDKIELLEDEIYRIGPCPQPRCLLHHRETQVRSTCSSNEKFEVVSPKKAAKIRKINVTPEIQLENKFDSLMEIDKQNDLAEDKKSANDIPAIYLLMDSNYNLTLQEIANKFPKTTNKLVKGFISITADTEENRINIINYLNETNKEYVLSEKREDRPLKIIIKRLPTDHSKDLIKQDIENHNFKCSSYNFQNLCQESFLLFSALHPTTSPDWPPRHHQDYLKQLHPLSASPTANFTGCPKNPLNRKSFPAAPTNAWSDPAALAKIKEKPRQASTSKSEMQFLPNPSTSSQNPPVNQENFFLQMSNMMSSFFNQMAKFH